MWSILLLVIISLLAGLVAWIFFIWTVKDGQYKDIEAPKYRMLDDD